MNSGYILTLCLNPVLQKTIVLPRLQENKVNRSSEYYFNVSGKGVNVSRVLRHLKVDVLHLTQAGGRNRELFLDMCRQDDIPVRWTDSGSEIRFCYTLINREHHTSTEIVEEAAPVAPGTEEKIEELFLSLLPGCCAVIISGSKAAGFSSRLYPGLVKKAKEAGKITILDYRKDDLKNSLAALPDVIKPNYTEFVATFFPGQDSGNWKDKDELDTMVTGKIIQLWKDYGIMTILTNGENRVRYVDGGKIRSVVPQKIVPVNTIGCGDAFAAGFADVYVRSGDVTEAVHSGLECARKNALSMKPGQLYEG
jgi:fructose-1-phosphate kinase PfkB-like protein